MIEFLTTHYKEIFAIIGGIVSTASIIVKITPSKRDDLILHHIIDFLEKFSIINTKENQEIINICKK